MMQVSILHLVRTIINSPASIQITADGVTASLLALDTLSGYVPASPLFLLPEKWQIFPVGILSPFH